MRKNIMMVIIPEQQMEPSISLADSDQILTEF